MPTLHDRDLDPPLLPPSGPVTWGRGRWSAGKLVLILFVVVVATLPLASLAYVHPLAVCAAWDLGHPPPIGQPVARDLNDAIIQNARRFGLVALACFLAGVIGSVSYGITRCFPPRRMPIVAAFLIPALWVATIALLLVDPFGVIHRFVS